MTKTVPIDTDYTIDTTDNPTEVPSTVSKEDEGWIELAHSNFNTAKGYQDSALTTQWERNADHFNNRHYRRSIYNSRFYKGRSRIFRPLTRSAERSASATAAAALFSNMRNTEVRPNNHNDPMQVASANIMQQILEYRLSKTIPWFLTCMGAWQDTRVYGPCCTYTTWEFLEREVEKVRKVPKLDMREEPIPGEFDEETYTETEVLIDKPVIEMIPPENLLLDPECDWRDPVGSSPYVIRLKPMHLDDILAKMNEDDTKTTAQKWRTYSTEEILSVSSDTYNSVGQAREGDQRPNKSDSQERDEFKVIWAHENYVRLQGEEYVYWTLGTELLLTEPAPLGQVYHTGMRPLTYGFSVIEAHRFSPSSATELISGLQACVNDVANQRLDNIKLALNKRYLIRRGAQVDLESLMRSVPGGGVTTDDPERDVKVIDTKDVTASSYREQERLETESNDLSGTFMGGSVQNNRSLNETVGGMELLSEGANAISEFDIRTFIETWVKPQLELLIQYIQAYETDDVIFYNAFDEAFKQLGYSYNNTEERAPGQFNQDELKQMKDGVLNNSMTITVNVGLGATSPQKKIDMFSYIMNSLRDMPDQLQRLDGDEIVKEMFAAAGFQDGERFLKGGKDGEQPEITEEDLEAAREEGMQAGVDQHKMAAVEMQREVGMAKLKSAEIVADKINQSKERIAGADMASRTGIAAAKDKTHRDAEAVKHKATQDELNFKRTTGKPGI